MPWLTHDVDLVRRISKMREHPVAEQTLARLVRAPHAFNGWLNRKTRILADSFVQEVPPSLAVCEFDCAETECSLGEWLVCARRLQGKAELARH